MSVASKRAAPLFLAWLGIFAGISVLLWTAIEFWGRRMEREAPPRAAPAPPGSGVRVSPPPDNSPLLDLRDITESSARLSLVGRMAQFDNVTVTEAGKSSFRIGRNGGQTLFVSSWEEGPPGVRKGQRINVRGLILGMPAVEGIQKRWGFAPAQAAQLGLEQVYLRASTIEAR